MNSFSLLVAILVSLQLAFEASALNRIPLRKNVQSGGKPKKTRLSIAEAPPSTVTLEPGKRLVLKCVVVGDPMPHIEWMKNGVPAVDYEGYSNDFFPEDPSIFGIVVGKLVVTTAVYGDIFTCVGRAKDREQSASTTVFTTNGDDIENLVTLQKLFQLPAKPIITFYYHTALQNQGSDIVLPCRVLSSEKTEIFWEDIDGKIIYDHPRMQMLPSGSLLLRNVQWNDMGPFTCTATDIYGRNATETTFFYPLAMSKVQ